MNVRVDYKPDSTWRARRQVRFYGLLVITLVFVGFFGSVLAYISKHPADIKLGLPPIQGVQDALKGLPTANPAATDDKPKPKYDFYKVLPERRLMIHKEELKPPPPAHPQTSATDSTSKPARAAKPANPTGAESTPTPAPRPDPAVVAARTPSGNYVLQAGSFRSQSEATRLQASLNQLGVSARVISSAGADGVTLHRVLIGPIEDANKAEALRRRLQGRNIQAITVRTN